MTVYYEWDVETVTVCDSEQYEEGEVLEHYHCDSYAEAVQIASDNPEEGTALVIVLVRDDDYGRAWAYLHNGKLPPEFEDAAGRRVAKVPQRFVREVERSAALS